MVALNAKLTNVSKCQTEEIWWHLNAKLANGSKCRTKNMMALNAQLTNGSKCRTEDIMVLNAKLTNGSECLTMNDDFWTPNCGEMVALNAKLRIRWL